MDKQGDNNIQKYRFPVHRFDHIFNHKSHPQYMEIRCQESMKKPFLRSRKPQKKQKRLEKGNSISWGKARIANSLKIKGERMY